MSTHHASLLRLLDLLSNCEQSPDSLHEITSQILLAEQSPEAMGRAYGPEAQAVAESHPDSRRLLALSYELDDYFALGNSVDEIWEEILAAFESPDMPAFPYEDMPFQDIESFFVWADEQLLESHPDYGLIEFAPNPEYEFQLILVKRAYITDILSLCDELGLSAATIVDA